MTVDTRYLILGDYPEGRQQAERRSDFDVKSEQADTLGIEPISLTDFLRLMGWQSEQRTVKLGIGAEGKDFPAKKEEVADPIGGSLETYRTVADQLERLLAAWAESFAGGSAAEGEHT